MTARTARAARKLGFPVARLHHGSIREGVRTAGEYDLVICPARLAGALRGWQGRVTVAGLQDPLSDEALEGVLRAWLRDHPDTDT